MRKTLLLARLILVSFLLIVTSVGSAYAMEAPEGFIAFDPPRALPEYQLFYDEMRQPHSLSDFKGKIVVLNFWATWCGTCIKKLPYVDAASRQLKEKGLEVVAVSLDFKGMDAVLPYFDKHDVSLNPYVDNRTQLFQAFGGASLPTMFLINREGKAIGRLERLDWKDPATTEWLASIL